MNLDDLERFHTLDAGGMMDQIDGLPDQLQSAWDLGQRLPLPEWKGVQRVVVAGMGGSAIGADLLRAYVEPLVPVPLGVWRGYDLPAWGIGPETLLVTSSHSGNTEETLSAFDLGLKRGVRLLAVTRGGELASRAENAGVPVWRFEHEGQPRAAVGFSFGLLLAVLGKLELLPDPSKELLGAVGAMKTQQQALKAESPVSANLAKRVAGQLMDRWPMIIGGGLLAPVARRWRTQISEVSKALAQFEELPEADHNMVAGVINPEALIQRAMVMFLNASTEHPRLQLRVQATRNVMMVEGFNTDVVEAQGDTRLAQQWTSLLLGDYAAFYLAMAYGVDPTPVAAIESLKAKLKEG
jgi:glucose/mannose-6-phosphate isomerase